MIFRELHWIFLWISNEIDDFTNYYKSSRPADPDSEVLVPGEIELIIMKERSQNGIPLSKDVWEDILNTSKEVGVDASQINDMKSSCKIIWFDELIVNKLSMKIIL